MGLNNEAQPGRYTFKKRTQIDSMYRWTTDVGLPGGFNKKEKIKKYSDKEWVFPAYADITHLQWEENNGSGYVPAGGFDFLK